MFSGAAGTGVELIQHRLCKAIRVRCIHVTPRLRGHSAVGSHSVRNPGTFDILRFSVE